MLLALLLLAAPPPPLAAADDFPAADQWAAVLASPKVVTTSVGAGQATSVVVAVKDKFAYILTAEHAVKGTEDRELRFYTEKSYPLPDPDRTLKGLEVVLRLPAADAALLKVKVGDRAVPVRKLAGPGERPKTFPAAALSVGCTDAGPPTCELVSVRAKKLVRRKDGEVAFFWETAAPPKPGRSGGPLMSPAGKVIGLAAAEQGGAGYYSHLDELLAGLKQGKYGWLWE